MIDFELQREKKLVKVRKRNDFKKLKKAKNGGMGNSNITFFNVISLRPVLPGQ